MKDAYDILFHKYPKEEFFKDGIEGIIFAPLDKLEANWNSQKQKLLNNEELYIRSYGRNGVGTNAFVTLYKYLFLNNKIKRDPTNNAKPTQVITELTRFCKVLKVDNNKKERIQNYQVSHLFGKTKNPLLFTAGWNIAYIPKYLDPFTGHETQGEYRKEFQDMFRTKIYGMFTAYIEDYNLFISKQVLPKLQDALVLTKQELEMSDYLYDDFASNAIAELSLINLTDNSLLEKETDLKNLEIKEC